MKSSIINNLYELRKGNLTPKNFIKKQHVTGDLIKRLRLEKELTGHSGCVNCLEWNETGDLLASGSDDTHVMIWDAFNYKCKTNIDTRHHGNIFSVKFMPKANNTKLATGAADFIVKIIDISHETVITDYTCHFSRVKRLAVCATEPYLLWSCSEDGTIRQFDIRQNNTSNEPNILINLNHFIGPSSEAKCLAINPVRTDQIAVGSNDPYVRIFDRRKLSLSSNSANSSAVGGRRSFHKSADQTISDNATHLANIPSNVVQYFIPGHIPHNSSSVNGNGGSSINNGSNFHSKIANSQLSTTYLNFSPDGRHLLVNMGSEQIYLYDVNKSPGSRPAFNYQLSVCGKRVAQLAANGGDDLLCNYCKKGDTKNSSHNTSIQNCKQSSTEFDSNLPPHLHKLKEIGNKKYKDKDYLSAVLTYNKALNQGGDKYARFFANRAAAYISRQWTGDMYAALQDSARCLELEPDHFKSHFRVAQCMFYLNLIVESYDYMKYLESTYLEQTKIIKQFSDLKKKITDSLSDCIIKEKNAEKNRDPKSKKTTTTLSGSSSSSSTSTNSLPLETLKNGNLDIPSLIGKHLKIRRYSERNLPERELNWRTNGDDYVHRYCGHCNTTTDIKEANFFGIDGQYIMAGSDDGNIFFWERDSENLFFVFCGDSNIVNCLQPHPTTCFLASSGIDSVVRLWSPGPEKKFDDNEYNNKYINDDTLKSVNGHSEPQQDDPGIGFSSCRRNRSSSTVSNEIGTIQNELTAALSNQERLSVDPFEVVLMNMGLHSTILPRDDDNEDDDDDDDDEEEEEDDDDDNNDNEDGTDEGDNNNQATDGSGEASRSSARRFRRSRREQQNRRRRRNRQTIINFENSDYCRAS